VTRDAHFWSIIDKAHRSGDALRPMLEAMSREELLELWRTFQRIASDLQEGPWVTRRTDGAQEVTWWIMGMGKAFYDDIVAHPEKFPKEVGPDGRGFGGMISRVYFERFDEEIEDADARDD
jgi:hypothetical protein